MVRKRGLEPPRPKMRSLAPQASVSTISPLSHNNIHIDIKKIINVKL